MTSKKVYMAGAWSQRDVIHERMAELQALGWTITHDWTQEPENRPERKAECAVLDIQGVLDADVVVGFMNLHDYAYRGTWTELGAALGTGRRIVLYTPWEALLHDHELQKTPASNVFFHHPAITRCQKWSDVLAHLNKLS